MDNHGESSWTSASALEFLQRLNEDYMHLQEWTLRVLNHPWFKSLWTLQEMVLRPDAYILLDDALLRMQNAHVSMHTFHGAMPTAMQMLYDSSFEQTVQKAADSVSHCPPAEGGHILDGAIFKAQLRFLVSMYRGTGLDILTMQADFPHSIYSAAQSRRATRLADRILGIMQIYGISCVPQTPGADDETAQLC